MNPRSSALLSASFALAAAARADQVDDLVRTEMAARHIPGAVVAVVKDGDVAKQAAYGLANVELGVKVTIDSVFEIGSVTKQFTATLIMMLVQEGKLTLDAPIGTVLPGSPAAWSAITLRMLLGHTSGLKNVNDVPGLELHANLTPEQIVEKLAPYPLEFKPG